MLKLIVVLINISGPVASSDNIQPTYQTIYTWEVSTEKTSVVKSAWASCNRVARAFNVSKLTAQCIEVKASETTVQ